jgi:hypothetical protein
LAMIWERLGARLGLAWSAYALASYSAIAFATKGLAKPKLAKRAKAGGPAWI